MKSIIVNFEDQIRILNDKLNQSNIYQQELQDNLSYKQEEIKRIHQEKDKLKSDSGSIKEILQKIIP